MKMVQIYSFHKFTPPDSNLITLRTPALRQTPPLNKMNTKNRIFQNFYKSANIKKIIYHSNYSERNPQDTHLSSLVFSSMA